MVFHIIAHTVPDRQETTGKIFEDQHALRRNQTNAKTCAGILAGDTRFVENMETEESEKNMKGYNQKRGMVFECIRAKKEGSRLWYR